MGKFMGIELLDVQTKKRKGVRYINLDCICRADYVNPTEERGKGEMDVTLADGFTFHVDGQLAEEICLHMIENLKNPAKS